MNGCYSSRDIVKLTAQFVAKNGTSFLERLMQKEQRSYQFDFLRKHHPLFSYFTKLVEQYSKVSSHCHCGSIHADIGDHEEVGFSGKKKYDPLILHGILVVFLRHNQTISVFI